MAAHQIEGILDVLAYMRGHTSGRIVQYIQPAVDLHCWSDQNPAAWQLLNTFCDEFWTTDLLDAKAVTAHRDELEFGLIRLLPDAISEWMNLGEPTTMEEWYARKYPKEDENDNDHTD
ncbi:MAG: hypothetical protein ACXADF_14910 [Candidatus Thorarchaeota archaeon]